MTLKFDCSNDTHGPKQNISREYSDSTVRISRYLYYMKLRLTAFLSVFSLAVASAAPLKTAAELVKAAAAAPPGTIIELAAGTFALSGQLELKSGTILKGAGMDKTILTNTAAFKGNPATLPDPEQNHKKFDRTGYLIQLEEKCEGITISDLTLTGPELHGAIFSWGAKDLHIHDIAIKNFMYCGYRSYDTRNLKFHDSLFVDAGMRWEKGKPGLKGGITGGGIFFFWLKESEIFNNRFLDTKEEKHRHYYGIKGRQAKNSRIHHNTIETNFSIELAFENDENVEIDHNICYGTISIPKHSGGPVPKDGYTFHIHHNYFTHGYAIEYSRNGAEIDNNLFDFDVVKADGNNLISEFGNHTSEGPTVFHNNLINNPGRGVMWLNGPYANLTVRNNHVITRTTPTPRKEGLFGFHSKSDFKTFVFDSNIIECLGQERPLFRNDESGKSKVENNKLVNISDTSRYQNKMTGAKIGPEKNLKFACGVNGELLVDGWEATPKK